MSRYALALPSRGVLLFTISIVLGFIALTIGSYQLKINTSIDINGLSGMVHIAFWSFLIFIASRTEVRLPIQAAISHVFVVALAVAILFPPWISPLLAALMRFGDKPGSGTYVWYKDVFNRAQGGLATAVAAILWHSINSTALIEIEGVTVQPYVAILVASAAYFVTNVGVVAYVIHLSSGVPIRKVWHENFRWLAGSYLLLSPVALFLANSYQTPLVGGWGGFTVLVFMLLLYFSRFYWDEKVKLEDSFNATIDTLVQALDAKDTFTRLHSERVAAIATDLARAKGLDEADRRKIAYGARIHDIGKVGIPDDVLLKPIRLTSQEFELIKSHTTRGAEILKPAARYFKEVLPIVLYHHERWDGRGYPEGRAGDAIPLWARIVCIADAYEAMTAGRSYSPPKSPQRAMQELEDLAGDQFDPELVKLFKGIWLQDPIWKDREVFLRSYTSPVPSLDLPLPSRSESAPATSPKSS